MTRIRLTCRTCGKPKKIPANKQKGVDQSVYLRDPYCSRKCLEADLAK